MRSPTTILITSMALAVALPGSAETESDTERDESLSVGVVSSSDRLPPVEGEYHGTSSHIFMGGAVRLTCGGHGTFEGNGLPPKKKGEAVDIDYLATFIGDLAITSPSTGETTVYPLNEEIRMVERVKYVGRDRGARVFDVELVSLEFPVSGFPDGVIARESTQRRTLGCTTIRRLPRRRFLIETTYDVWMELSVDGGREWHQQEVPVKMMLVAKPLPTVSASP